MIRFPFGRRGGGQEESLESAREGADQTRADQTRADQTRADETRAENADQTAAADEGGEQALGDAARAGAEETGAQPAPRWEPQGARQAAGPDQEAAGGGGAGEAETTASAASGALAETDAISGDPLDRPSIEQQVRMVEAMLFASEKPLSTAELASRMPMGCDAALAVRRLEDLYASRGVHLARVAGKWAFRTAPDLAHLLSEEAVETRKLSRAALETLAIIAYHQPVTRAEIEEIRQVGVSKGTVDLLMELEWVKLGRRRQTPGRPVTFVTTEAFLAHFGLENVKDLPRLDELRQSGLLDSRPPVGYAPTPGTAEAAEERLADGVLDGLGDDEDEEEAERANARQQDLLM